MPAFRWTGKPKLHTRKQTKYVTIQSSTLLCVSTLPLAAAQVYKIENSQFQEKYTPAAQFHATYRTSLLLLHLAPLCHP